MISSFTGEYSFLSNFYKCNIEYDGVIYPSVEHYYVAMKIDVDQKLDDILYTISDFRLMISKVKTPNQAKRIGRQMILRKDWDIHKLVVMNWAVREKFKNYKYAKLLIATGDEELVEGNWWHDTYWGVCNGVGKNHLGKILMKVRDELNGVKRTGLEEILK